MRVNLVHVFTTMKVYQVHLSNGEVWYNRYSNGASVHLLGDSNHGERFVYCDLDDFEPKALGP